MANDPIRSTTFQPEFDFMVTEKEPTLTGKYSGIIQLGVILILAYLSSYYSYLLFHSLSEMISTVIAFGIFAVTWNSRRYFSNNYFLLVGVSFFFVGLIAALHIMAYQGMAVFPHAPGANLATQLWLAERYLAGISFFLASFFIGKKLKGKRTFSIYLFITATLLALIFLGIFPAAYIDGRGLTIFKKISEAVIMLLFAGALIRLYAKRDKFDSRIFDLLVWSIIFTIIFEVLFTFYSGVYDFVNMAGHLLQIASFYLIYLAVIETGLKKPYRFLFKELKDSEMAHREGENKFRAIFENAAVGIVLADMNGRLLEINDKFRRMIGYDERELQSLEFSDITHPDDRSLDLESFREMKSGKLDGYFSEKRYLRKDGKVIWIDVNVSLIRDIKGEPKFTMGVIRDISKRKSAEAEIKKVAKFPEENPNPVLRINQKGLIVYANPNSRELIEFWGSSVGAVVPERWKKIIERVLDTDVKEEVSETFGNKIISFMIAPLKEYGYVNLYGRDITDKQKAEEELQQRERDLQERNKTLEKLTVDLEKFQLAVKNAKDLIIIIDPEGKIIFANKAAEEITGYTWEEMVNRKASLWGGGMKEDFYNEMLQTIREQKLPFSGEIINKRKSGEPFIVEAHVSPIIDEQDNVAFFVGIERDITKAKEIDRAKTEFVSLASHQLRTPLASISLAAELLLRGVGGKVEEGQKKYIKEIYNSTERMSGLIDVLLNISRIELGTFAVKPEPLDFVKNINRVLSELALQISNKKLKLKKSYSKHLPIIQFDQNVLRIITENLITNAIRYTPEGGQLMVKLDIHNSDILLTVSDTGFGIPKKATAKIFTKLFRAENAKEISSDGAGLGLYIVKSVVDKVGAKIWFESKEGEGTTFYVSIPLKESLILK